MKSFETEALHLIIRDDQAKTGVQPASYPMGTRGSLLGVKAAGT
jgi:hypothetical protein